MTALLLAVVAAGVPSVFLPLQQAQWHFSSTLLALATALYALVVLVTLLVLGSLSDHLGRRPVILVALGFELGALVILAAASSIGIVLIGRAVQAVATGLLSSALSAYIGEIAPPRLSRPAAWSVSVIPLLGLGIGTLAGGLSSRLLQTPEPVLYGTLAVMTPALLIGSAFAAETRPRRPGGLASLRPSLDVPAASRKEFLRAVPLLAATWAAVGLFLGLLPVGMRTLWGIGDLLAVGSLILLFTAAASIGVLTARTRTTGLPQLVVYLLGVASVVVSIASHEPALLLIGSGAVGWGAGGCFTLALRSLVAATAAHQRGGVLSAAYVVNYVAFGVPTLAAGRIADLLGLPTALISFCVVLAVLAGWGIAVAATRPVIAAGTADSAPAS